MRNKIVPGAFPPDPEKKEQKGIFYETLNLFLTFCVGGGGRGGGRGRSKGRGRGRGRGGRGRR